MPDKQVSATPGATVESRPFWSANQPGFRFTTAPQGSEQFFREVEAHRYALEPHIPEIVRFEHWEGADVLEAGCGIATDGVQFARAGARYTGLDATDTAIDLARRRFTMEGLEGTFHQGSVTEMPFADDSFDFVYSHGVIHHVPDTERAIDEFRRVLRPGGTALVMVYHRGSLNYWLNILLVRRALAMSLIVPGATSAVARLTGERLDTVAGHRALLREHGLRYLSDTSLFLSHNTDGPGNLLSKVYSRAEAEALFRRFGGRRVAVRFLNLRLYPGGGRLAASRLGRRLERRFGWHLYVEAEKPR